MTELEGAKVHIKDRENVERVINNMIADGKDSLQVIADFDRTLSRFSCNGEMVHTTHNALDESSYLPQSYKDKAIPLRDHYYAIEIDHNLTFEEKLPHMVDWWRKAHELLMDCHITRETITNIVREANILLREHTAWMFKILHDHEIPLLIFSAGLGDVIEEVIKQQMTFYDNIKVVSNYMEFDDQDNMTGFKGKTIHVYNKNENAIHDSDYFKTIEHCENIILMGDSMGDLSMANGAANIRNILRIGFLNTKVEDNLENYMDKFDIVLVGDETMDIPNALLRKILKVE